jgi:sugar (pentulose or hexulose) kinase
MFPIDSNTNNFDATRIAQYNKRLANEKLPYTLEDIFPAVQIAGETAGTLTTEGAKLLDPAGNLQAGIPLCPPEGDAGTGMVATNAVAARTGNVSAGTSVFAMIVLEKELSKLYPEIDMVTTPSGKPVAMVHANNCTSDINAWIALFGQFLEIMGIEFTQNTLFETLYKQALEGDPDAGGLLSYNYFSGEPITHFEDGRPLFVRSPESKFTLANFMRTHLYSALGALNIGMNILFEKEKVKIEKVLGHGGFFKTEVVGQAIMAAALNVPISVMDTAGEGGAWGIALLVAYMTNKANGETLETYLNEKVFADKQGSTLSPTQKDLDGFKTFMTRYKTGLAIEKTAIETLNS